MATGEAHAQSRLKKSSVMALGVGMAYWGNHASRRNAGSSGSTDVSLLIDCIWISVLMKCELGNSGNIGDGK